MQSIYPPSTYNPTTYPLKVQYYKKNSADATGDAGVSPAAKRITRTGSTD